MSGAAEHYARTQAFHDEAAQQRGGFYDWRPGQGGAPRHSRWQVRARERVIGAVAALAEGGALGSLLHVGCGRGDFSRALLARFPGVRVTGVDFSADMVALAGRDAAPGLNFRVASLPELALGDAMFDVVVCLNVFHHVHGDDQARALGSMLKRARRGLVLEIKNAGCPYKRLPRGRWLDASTRVFPTTARAVADMAGLSGFVVTRESPLFGLNWLSPIVVLTLEREDVA